MRWRLSQDAGRWIAQVVLQTRVALLRSEEHLRRRHRASLVTRILCRIELAVTGFVPLRDGPFVKSIYGPWLHVRDDATFDFCANGAYGFFFSDFLASTTQPSVFVDVGANIGLYSLVASRNPAFVAVHAFEPSSGTVEFLRANIARNNATGVVIHDVAVMDNAGRSNIVVHAGHSGRSAIVGRRMQGDGGHVAYEAVDVVSTDYLDAALGETRPSPIVLKVDVEGSELQVLSAFSASVVWPDVHAIWCESSRDRDSDALSLFLRGEGFREDARVGDSQQWDSLFLRVDGSE